MTDRFKSIPDELKNQKSWLLWKLEQNNQTGRTTKKPYGIKGFLIDPTNKDNMVSFQEVVATLEKAPNSYNGIGYAFFESDPYTCVDLDHFINDGKINPEAEAVIKSMNSYSEISQSGEGVHIIVKAKKPEGRCRTGNFEIYNNKRFFAVTGNHIGWTPKTIEERQSEVEQLHSKYFPPKEEPKQVTHTYEVSLNESEIIEKAMNAKNGSKFRDLFNGQWQVYYPSQSEADLALCSMIAFYTQDFQQIDNIFKSSGLYREKWDREDIKRSTITKALSGLSETYSGKIEKLQPAKPQLTAPSEEAEQNIQYKFNTISHYLEEGFWKELQKNTQKRQISTGIKELDTQLGGTLYSGIYCIGAISSLGKTAFMGQVADNIASQGIDVIFFSLEMGTFEMVCRSLTRELFKKDPRSNYEITTGHIINGKLEAESIIPIIETYQETIGNHISIIEGNFDVSIESIKQTIENHIRETGRKPVVIIDYLQVIKPIDFKMTDKQATDFNIIELKRLTRALDISIIAISSFNRTNYNNEITFEAFKESGAIEYTCDVVMGLQLRGLKEKNADINELKNREPREIELVLLKNRRGKAYSKIKLDYYPKHNYFVEVKP